MRAAVVSLVFGANIIQSVVITMVALSLSYFARGAGRVRARDRSFVKTPLMIPREIFDFKRDWIECFGRIENLEAQVSIQDCNQFESIAPFFYPLILSQ